MNVIIKNQAIAYQFVVLLIFMFYCSTTFCQSEIKKHNAILKINPKPNTKEENYPMGKTFDSGTMFETTEASVIIGAHKNLQILKPHTIHKVIFNDDEETHITYQGKVVHDIHNEIGYTIAGNGVKLKPNGTKFEVEVNKKYVILTMIKGKVNTFQKVPIVITSLKGKKRTKNKLSKTKFKSVGEGDDSLIFDRYPDSDPDESFDSVEDALAFFIRELKLHKESGYPDEQLADDYNLIGELYLDLDEHSEAIYYFEDALEKYGEIKFSGQELAEVYLNLTEAYDYFEDEYDNVVMYGNLAIEYLKVENKFNLEDLIYAEEDSDYELIDMIKEDLNFNYWNMGWIYEITNRPILAKDNDEKAKKYIKNNNN